MSLDRIHEKGESASWGKNIEDLEALGKDRGREDFDNKPNGEEEWAEDSTENESVNINCVPYAQRVGGWYKINSLL